MRVCSLCKREKLDEDFNFKYKSRGIRQRHCRKCTRFEIRRHYLANKEYYLRKARIRNEWYRKMMSDYVLKFLKIHPCVDCGEKDPLVLEFDHMRDKFKAISRMRSDNSFEKLKTEVSKCQVRCANCHRRKTFSTMGDKMYKMPP